MFFVCICHLLVCTAKTKIHGFLVLTSAKRFTYINARATVWQLSKASIHICICTAPISSYRQMPSGTLSPVAVQKGNNQTDSYHIQ